METVLRAAVGTANQQHALYGILGTALNNDPARMDLFAVHYLVKVFFLISFDTCTYVGLISNFTIYNAKLREME
jgi:hypothetical protein